LLLLPLAGMSDMEPYRNSVDFRKTHALFLRSNIGCSRQH
jgi:hypothetical protein